MVFSRPHRSVRPELLLLLALLAACGGGGNPPPRPPEQGDVMWTSYLGSTLLDRATGVAAHAAGGVVVSAITEGSVAGGQLGGSDTLIARFTADGTLLWLQQTGGSGADETNAVSSDLLGNVVVVGSTSSNPEGGQLGHLDAFVRKHDANGEWLWTRQFGGPAADHALGAAVVDGEQIVVAGWTLNPLAATLAGGSDAYLRLYDAEGNALWTQQFGSVADDAITAVATSSNGHIFVAGWTRDDIEGENAGPNFSFDAFVRHYFPDGGGQVGWTRQFGTAQDDLASAVAVDADGNVYVAGHTSGSLAGVTSGNIDAFLRKYSLQGVLQWTRQFGTLGNDLAQGLAIDADGNVVVVGTTNFDLAGPVGMVDAFVRVYDPAGDVLWTRQFGGPVTGISEATGAAVGADGEIVVVGRASLRFDGSPAQGDDAFIQAYVP